MKAMRLARTVFDRARAAAAGHGADVVLKSDGSGWILDQFCAQLQAGLHDRLSIYTSAVPVAGLRGSIVHFIGGECFYDVNWRRGYHESNAFIGTWWHGSDTTDDAQVRAAYTRIEPVSRGIAAVHVTCTPSRDAVRRAGVADDRIALVPMGVDLTMFRPPSGDDRSRARDALSIPQDAVVVGSFQKDGVGWGEGNEPKVIKGPDVFLRVLSRLAQRLNVLALIPGPSRGYLKRELQAAGVPFRADGFVPLDQFPAYYHACDVYLMTGREEGGPASVLESLASGTPFVGHRVGMAPDVIRHGVDGFLADVGDVDGLASGVQRLADAGWLREQLAREGRATAVRYGWDVIAPQYERLYAALRSAA